nr:MAG TPA: hypothetical protein [Bacteriophage sp.]
MAARRSASVGSSSGPAATWPLMMRPRSRLSWTYWPRGPTAIAPSMRSVTLIWPAMARSVRLMVLKALRMIILGFLSSFPMTLVYAHILNVVNLSGCALPHTQPAIHRLPSHPRSQRRRPLRHPSPNRSHHHSPTLSLHSLQSLTHRLHLTAQTIQLQQTRPPLGTHDDRSVLTRTVCRQASQIPSIVKEFPCTCE